MNPKSLIAAVRDLVCVPFSLVLTAILLSTAHPVPWSGTLPLVIATSHATAANMLHACALCHGATLGGGAGPACTSCHTAGSPLSFSNCTSCHGNPPNGTASPNVAGQHAVHVGLGSYIICNTCHNGAGTNTLNHDYGSGVVNVAFLSAYNAASGSASGEEGSGSAAGGRPGRSSSAR